MGGGGREHIYTICLLFLKSEAPYQRVSSIATQNTTNSRIHRGDHRFAGCHLLCDLWDGKHKICALGLTKIHAVRCDP